MSRIKLRHNILKLALKIRELPENEFGNTEYLSLVGLDIWCKLVDRCTKDNLALTPDDIVSLYIDGKILVSSQRDRKSLNYGPFILTNIFPPLGLYNFRKEVRPTLKDDGSREVIVLHDDRVYESAQTWFFIVNDRIVDQMSLLVSKNGTAVHIYRAGGLPYSFNTACASKLIEKFCVEELGLTELYRIYEYSQGVLVACDDNNVPENQTDLFRPVQQIPTASSEYIRCVYDVEWLKGVSVDQIVDNCKGLFE